MQVRFRQPPARKKRQNLRRQHLPVHKTSTILKPVGTERKTGNLVNLRPGFPLPSKLNNCITNRLRQYIYIEGLSCNSFLASLRPRLMPRVTLLRGTTHGSFPKDSSAKRTFKNDLRYSHQIDRLTLPIDPRANAPSSQIRIRRVDDMRSNFVHQNLVSRPCSLEMPSTCVTRES